MKTKTTDDEILAKADAIRQRDRNAKRRLLVETENKRIGECYRYSNTYGHGPRWWLYARIDRVDRHGSIYAVTFETCSNGWHSIKPNSYSTPCKGNGWEQITAKQFKAALRVLIKRVASVATP